MRPTWAITPRARWISARTAISLQLGQLIEQGLDHVLEIGAGSGRLAADLLGTLDRSGKPLRRYSIVELSPALRTRQQRNIEQRVAGMSDRVEWLDALPDRFAGIIIGNELLDALPVHLVRRTAQRTEQLGVGWDESTAGFAWTARLLEAPLDAYVAALALPEHYLTEVHPAAHELVRTIGKRLERGVALFLDYGFPRAEYYHPERSRGTLMCHYRHHAHGEPLVLIGLQDLTTHLDFSALAQSAGDAGLDLLGYTSQANFLINCGLVGLLEKLDPADVGAYAPVAASVQRLLSPAEMGELVKVIAVGRGVDHRLLGFSAGDRSARL
jgi:SAM-dependent MidA family methyltransferase